MKTKVKFSINNVIHIGTVEHYLNGEYVVAMSLTDKKFYTLKLKNVKFVEFFTPDQD